MATSGGIGKSGPGTLVLSGTNASGKLVLNGGSAVLDYTSHNSNRLGVSTNTPSALTLGGYTNFAPLVKHSTDNVTFTTLGTFSVVTAAPNAQRLVVAAGTAVNRYLAMSWSYGGAGSGQSVKFFVGFARL